ncbi:hypothetical protein OH76DRAFT_1484536 [Lentinus brumalis]|uniref:Uncharacterized protein n=1 Tax=Lentinus brumalis TaxID=2498619 RepID=A0A371D503_9APHY|nr:hypothetical protein OH76DRAFT_1484536 [Polyporus brumalis]
MDEDRRLVITRLLALSTFCTQRVAQLSSYAKFSYNDYLDLFAAYKCCEEDADKALYAALHAARKAGHREDDDAARSSQEEGKQGGEHQEEARSEPSEEGDSEEADGQEGGSGRKAMVVVSAHDFDAFDNLREEFSSAVRQLDERLGSTYEWRMKNHVVPELILKLEVQLKNWFEEAVFPEMDERILRRLEYRLGSSIAKDVGRIIYPGLKACLLEDFELTQAKQHPQSVTGSDSPSSTGSGMHAGKRRRKSLDDH